MITKILICLILTTSTVFSQNGSNDSLFSISFGQVDVGQSKIPISLRDFKILYKKNNPKIKVGFLKNSVQWVRPRNNLLMPRARIGIKASYDTNVHFKYHGQTILPAFKKNKYFYSEIYSNLFNPGTIEIYANNKLVEEVTIISKKIKKKKETKQIDHSCLKYHLEFVGLENEYMSVGCSLDKTGSIGNERPRLQVTWASTNFTLLDGTHPPYISFLNDSSPVKVSLIDKQGNKRDVVIKAKIPKRLYRLKTAFGFGPYMFGAEENERVRDTAPAPAVMLYGKFDLGSKSSFRFFDALVVNESRFNNAGIYFAYEIADAFDKRVSIYPLLGAQILSFKYNKLTTTKHDFIYPQGFEAVFRHAFGLKNYTVVYGMFLSTSSSVTYDNLWVRWGRGYFWELNYIRWGQDKQEATTYGLSIGFPLANFY